MAITRISSTDEVSEITSVVITPIQQDTTRGDYVRDVRIMCGNIQAVELKLRAMARESLEITAPETTF